MASDLSVLIPARQEQWLRRTVDDVLSNRRGNTDVIVVLDGAWPEPGYELAQHPDVHVVKLGQSIGQRAATNLAARVSDARYVMKCDAHVAMGPGFDVEMITAAETLGRKVVQIPAQKHLKVFDWVCDACGMRKDQSPALVTCPVCGGSLHKDVVWEPRASPTSSSWRFDSDLHFQYWSGARSKQRGNAFPEVMSCLGACWFLDREWFLNDLDGLDNGHGSWGGMGTEVGCKAWLSGGRMVCNKKTWFAHFFRVGGHKFPYEIHAEEQDYARRYSQNLWRGNHWPGQVKPLRWLVEKFSPPGWNQEQIDALPSVLSRVDVSDPRLVGGRVLRVGDETDATHRPGRGARDESIPRRIGADAVSAGIVYYTDLRAPEHILTAVQAQLVKASGNMPINVVTCESQIIGDTPFEGYDANGRVGFICLPDPIGYLSMFKQILCGLEKMDTDYAFLAEHDVLYDESHFEFRPPRDDLYYYNTNVWQLDAKTGRAVSYLAKRTSQLCANRELLVRHYRKRVAMVEQHGFIRAMGFEPGSHGRKERVDDIKSDVWRSRVPSIDIKHGKNLTAARWSPSQFRDQRNCREWQDSDTIPGWGKTLGCFDCFLRKLGQREEVLV